MSETINVRIIPEGPTAGDCLNPVFLYFVVGAFVIAFTHFAVRDGILGPGAYKIGMIIGVLFLIIPLWSIAWLLHDWFCK